MAKIGTGYVDVEANLEPFKRQLNSQMRTLAGMGSAVGGSYGKAFSRSVVRNSDALTASLDRQKRSLHGLQTAARRGIFAGGAGAGFITAKALKDGIRFNAQMESGTLALKRFLGGSKQAKGFLEDLFDVAKRTPFEFTDLTEASRRLLAFGLSAKQTKETLSAVGDAIAAAGGGAEQIDRVTLALGQMQAKGKVSAEELLQLTESGIPAYKILRDQLHLTNDEVSKIGLLGISSEKAIKALTKGMNKDFKGAAAEQAKTWDGMVSTMKDNWAQTTGAMTKGLFNELKQWAPVVNDTMSDVSRIFNRKDLDLEEKFKLSRVKIRQNLKPLAAEIDRADIPEKLGKAFSDALPIIFNVMGRGAGGAVKAFISGWLHADAWGKLITSAFLLQKMGAFAFVGKKVAGRFAERFAATAGADIAASTAVDGALGGKVAGKGRWGGLGRTAGKWFGRGLVAAVVAEWIAHGDEIRDKVRETLGTDDDAFKNPTPSEGGGIGGGGLVPWEGWFPGRKGGRLTRKGFKRYQQGGMVPAAVSSGEMLAFPDGSTVQVPGHRTASDNVFANLPVGTAVFTGHGQSLLAQGASPAEALAKQMPHFQKGGKVHTSYSSAQLAGLARWAGFPPGAARIAGATAKGESQGDTLAWNRDGEDSRGLWQINVEPGANPQYRNFNLFDPEVNARVARKIWQAWGRKFNAWSVYKHGDYRKYLSNGPIPWAGGGAQARSATVKGRASGGSPGDFRIGPDAFEAGREGRGLGTVHSAIFGAVRGGSQRPRRTVRIPGVSAPAGGAQTAGGGVGTFDGRQVASWIIPNLQWARAHGWHGRVSSGFRSYAQQVALWNNRANNPFPVARPGTSNHEGSAWPRGAVDVSDWQTLRNLVGRAPFPHKLKWFGMGDKIHFSGTGHRRGGIVGFRAGGVAGQRQWMRGIWNQIAPMFGRSGGKLPFNDIRFGDSPFVGVEQSGELFWPPWVYSGKDRVDRTARTQLFIHELAHKFQRGKMGWKTAEGGAEGFARHAMRALGMRPVPSGMYGPFAKRAGQRRGGAWVRGGQFGSPVAHLRTGGVLGSPHRIADFLQGPIGEGRGAKTYALRQYADAINDITFRQLLAHLHDWQEAIGKTHGQAQARARGAAALVKAEAAHRAGRLARRADELARRADKTNLSYQVMRAQLGQGIFDDPGSVSSMALEQRDLRRNEGVMRDRRRMLRQARRVAQRFGNTQVAESLKDEIRELDTAIKQNIVSRFQQMRQLIRARAQERVDVAQFQVDLQNANLGLFEAGQRLTGAADTNAGRTARAGFLTQSIVPALQGMLPALQKAYGAALKTNDIAGARTIWLQMKQVQEQILSTQADANDLLQQNLDQITETLGTKTGIAGSQLTGLELHQRLAGTFDTPQGRQERAAFITGTIMPALQAQLADQQARFMDAWNAGNEKGVLTALAEATSIDNQIMQAQLDANELLEQVADNTAEATEALAEMLKEENLLWKQRYAVSQAQYGVFAGLPFAGSFADGGTVPGPMGRPYAAVVHGGEQIGQQPVYVIVEDGAVDRNKIRVIANGEAQKVVRGEVRSGIRVLPGAGGGQLG